MDVFAPAAAAFPAYPKSWYLFCASRQLRQRPFAREIFGQRLVAFRLRDGTPCVLDSRCSHFGADLGKGTATGAGIRCPFHHWEYGADGRCVHIPAANDVPRRARQTSFPVLERHGFLFVFNGAEPTFPLPFFPDTEPEELRPAAPYTMVLRCPWFLVGANHFDLQHFRSAHDRVLVGTPEVSCPAPFARRASATFAVAGASLQDRLTRRFAGPRVAASITDWCGNLMFTTATFARTRSYGMMATEPLGTNSVRVSIVVFLPHSGAAWRRALVDPVRLWLRRLFITRFLRTDTVLLHGIRYDPHGLLACDRELVEYLEWLATGLSRTARSEGQAEAGRRQQDHGTA